MPRYRVFHRRGWKDGDPEVWEDGLEPQMGFKFVIGIAHDTQQAQRMCENWGRKNPPGRYSDKAEFEEM